MTAPHIHAVIMAGGTGKRFWPWSRRKTPKQFLRLAGDESLLRGTVDRLVPLVGIARLFVITTRPQAKRVLREIPELPAENVLIEPEGKDTAPCVGLAAAYSAARDPEAVQIVVPADHLIADGEALRRTLRTAVDVAVREEGLVTIGIAPRHPETAYGYIQKQRPVDGRYDQPVFQVKAFAEKPNPATARRFLDSGEFYWNSGMFIWQTSRILAEFQRLMPEFAAGLEAITAQLRAGDASRLVRRVYRQTRAISVDYAIMEKARSVFVVEGRFAWSDVGHWAEVYHLGDKDEAGNVVVGDAVLRDTAGTLVYGGRRLVATLGVKDLVIVDTPDALLVCHRDQAQDIKALVDELHRQGRDRYL